MSHNHLAFEVQQGWEQLPAGWAHADVAGVATDAEDRVYLYTRSTPRVIVYNRDVIPLRRDHLEAIRVRVRRAGRPAGSP